MITAIIPTFNRGYSLKLSLGNILIQDGINEVVLVDDCGTDDTKEVFFSFQNRFPHISFRYFKNDCNRGAAYSRMVGVEKASNNFILFCDDDDLLESNYTRVCLEYFNLLNADLVTGRHFYRQAGEKISDAISRYKDSLRKVPVFNQYNFTLNNSSFIDGHVELPFSHGILLTTKELLESFPLDPSYSHGNGYREETDFQVRAFLSGRRILMVSDTHAVGLNRSEVKTGGQRVGRLARFYWTLKYSFKFLDKYYLGLKEALGIKYSRKAANTIFVLYESYRFFIRPFGILFKRFLLGGGR